MSKEREMTRPVYRYKALVAAVGTDQEVQDLIKSCGFDPPPAATIRGWRTRNSVPAVWAPILIAHAMLSGKLKDPMGLIDHPTKVTRKPGKQPEALPLS